MSWLEEIQKEMDGVKSKAKKPTWINQITPTAKAAPYVVAQKDYSNAFYSIIFVLSLLTLVVYMDKYKMGFTDLVNLFRPAATAVKETPKEDVPDLASIVKKDNALFTEHLRLLVIVNNNNAQALKYGCVNDVVFITKDWKLSKWPNRVVLSAEDTAMLKDKIKTK